MYLLCDNMSVWLVVFSLAWAYADTDIINRENRYADIGMGVIHNHGMNKTTQIPQQQTGKSLLENVQKDVNANPNGRTFPGAYLLSAFPSLGILYIFKIIF